MPVGCKNTTVKNDLEPQNLNEIEVVLYIHSFSAYCICTFVICHKIPHWKCRKEDRDTRRYKYEVVSNVKIYLPRRGEWVIKKAHGLSWWPPLHFRRVATLRSSQVGEPTSLFVAVGADPCLVLVEIILMCLGHGAQCLLQPKKFGLRWLVTK